MLIELVLNRANNKNIIDNEISIQSKIIHPNIIRLYNYLDELNARGIRFGITNLVRHKGNTK